MTTIQIRNAGDTVFYLDSDGFQKGYVKTVDVFQETTHTDKEPKKVLPAKPLKIRYWVKTLDSVDIYAGLEKPGADLFDTYEEMIKHYSAVTL